MAVGNTLPAAGPASRTGPAQLESRDGDRHLTTFKPSVSPTQGISLVRVTSSRDCCCLVSVGMRSVPAAATVSAPSSVQIPSWFVEVLFASSPCEPLSESMDIRADCTDDCVTRSSSEGSVRWGFRTCDHPAALATAATVPAGLGLELECERGLVSGVLACDATGVQSGAHTALPSFACCSLALHSSSEVSPNEHADEKSGNCKAMADGFGGAASLGLICARTARPGGSMGT